MKPNKAVIIIFTIFTLFNSHSLFSYDPYRYYVAADILNMREKPDVKSKIVAKIRAGWNVDLIEKGKADKIGDMDGQWLYVESNHGDRSMKASDSFPKGWVFNYYIYDAYTDDGVEKVTSIKLKNNVFTTCDMACEEWYDYTINEDGSYFYYTRPYDTDETVRKEGHIYKFRNLYIFKNSGLMFYGDKELNFIIVDNIRPMFRKEQTINLGNRSLHPEEGFRIIKLLEEPKTEPMKKK